MAQGTAVSVIGSVEGRDWQRVALKDGGTGYVWAPLLGDEPAAAPKQPETKVAVGVYPERRPPGAVFRDCSECPELVVLPAGSFMMGSTSAERSWAAAQGAKPEWLTD